MTRDVTERVIKLLRLSEFTSVTLVSVYSMTNVEFFLNLNY